MAKAFKLTMNKYIAALGLTCLTFFQAFGTELSQTNNGFFLAIGGARSGTNEPVQYNENLIFLPFYSLYANTNSKLIELQYPDAEYCIKIKMTGPDNQEVPKTNVGKILGSKWDKLHDRSNSKSWFSVLVGNGYNSNIGANGGRLLLAPNDYFDIEQSGIYTLEIQMQMLRYTGSTDPNEQYRNLIRFSPIRIKVEKPPSAP